jgi:hypothetical protein
MPRFFFHSRDQNGFKKTRKARTSRICKRLTPKL